MKTKKEKYHGVSLRLSPEARRQLDEIMQIWGENRSRAICRAIEKTHTALVSAIAANKK